jgi:hypothetical protein
MVNGSRSNASAELLGQPDENALRAADVTEPILLLVLLQFANEFGAMGAQADKDILDSLDSEHDATYAQRVRRRVFRLNAGRRRPLEPHQLKPAVTVRGPHHRDVDSDAVEADDTVCPTSLDLRLALQLQTKLDKESNGGCEVVDNNTDVVHTRKCHIFSVAH